MESAVNKLVREMQQRARELRNESNTLAIRAQQIEEDIEKLQGCVKYNSSGDDTPRPSKSIRTRWIE